MEYTERQAQLTPSDKKELRKVIIGVGIFTVFALVIFGIGYNIVGAHGMDDVGIYIFAGFAVFFFGIILYMGGSATLDLTSGQKTIYSGVVSDKETRRSRSKKGSSSPKYLLHFGDKKLYVKYNHYGDVSVGDEIELHYAKRSGTSLSVVHLGERQETEIPKEKFSAKEWMNQRKEELASVEKKEYPLAPEDLRVLRRKRNGKVFTNAFILIFFTVMSLGFSLGSMLDWVFFIPVVIFLIIVFFCFKWIFRCFSKYSGDKREGVKVVAITNLKDKQTSSRRGSKSYSITTSYGTFPVGKEVYDGLQKGDKVYSFHGKHSNWLIGIHTEKSGYVAE
ncbi:MAG: hypothetical protein JXQ96_15005 [Cyclobacteriaceae bacterium]